MPGDDIKKETGFRPVSMLTSLKKPILTQTDN